jgi:hypothetical protein
MKNERHQNLSLKILENGHHDGVLNNGIQTVDLRCQIPNNSICTHACENKLAGGRVRVLRGVFGRIYAGLYVQACKSASRHVCRSSSRAAPAYSILHGGPCTVEHARPSMLRESFPLFKSNYPCFSSLGWLAFGPFDAPIVFFLSRKLIPYQGKSPLN